MLTSTNAKLFGISLALLAFITISVWYVARDFTNPPRLTVAFLDVGQGDAIFIESPTGKQILIDGGPDRSVVRELAHVMHFWDRTIDVVINTHPDRDHIGGLPEVLTRYHVSQVIDPGVPSDSGTYGYYRQLIERNDIPYSTAQRGQRIDLGDGAYADILYPDRDMSATRNDNDASVIVRVVYASTSVMLTGDASKNIEGHIVALDGGTLHADILKAGHHGSRTSSGAPFVTAVAPMWVVISAGKDNAYNHPHPEPLATFATAHSTVLGTYDLGTIVFESDGTHFVQK